MIMKKERKQIKDYAVITTHVDEKDGDIKIKARLKTWGKENLNGEIYEAAQYEKFIKSYYVEGGLNVPFTLNHLGNWDVNNVIGVVNSMDINDEGLDMEATIFGNCISDHVRTLINRGVLQGVSDEGWAQGYWDNSGKFHIEEMVMLAVSLVTTPAEVAAGIRVENTAFRFANETKGETKNAPKVKKLPFLK